MSGNQPGIMQSGTTKMGWSTCTAEWFRRFFAPGGDYNTRWYSACAESANDPEWRGPDAPVCGDGLVQGREQCDCPQNDCEGVDPCCDGTTCRLKAGAKCSPSSGECCDAATCAPKPKGSVCRPSTGPCDVADVCSGASVECGVDVISKPGTACVTPKTKLDGQCACGTCVSAYDYCRTEGRSTWLGPCGDPVNGFVGEENCGTDMYCYTSASRPNQCWGWSTPPTLWIDGLPCAEGKVCQGTSCVGIAQLKCPAGQAWDNRPTTSAPTLEAAEPSKSPTRRRRRPRFG